MAQPVSSTLDGEDIIEEGRWFVEAIVMAAEDIDDWREKNVVATLAAVALEKLDKGLEALRQARASA